ncbi:hypothetical protein AB1N83_006720 [Pleurotus pulmonarius]
MEDGKVIRFDIRYGMYSMGIVRYSWNQLCESESTASTSILTCKCSNSVERSLGGVPPRPVVLLEGFGLCPEAGTLGDEADVLWSGRTKRKLTLGRN